MDDIAGDTSADIPLVQVQADRQTRVEWPKGRATGRIEFSDQLWSGSFGVLQREVRRLTEPTLVRVDFSQVEWADPLPMLSLCATIREVMASAGVRLQLVIGEVNGVSRRRGGFLKFLVQQGFIDCLWVEGRTTCFLDNGPAKDKHELIKLVEETRTSAIYSNSRCLTARLVDLDNQCANNGARRLDTQANEIVSQWLREIDEHCLRRFFERDPELIANVQVKLRIILLELLLNAMEHAFRRSPGVTKTMGVMLRIRRSDDSHQSKQVLQNAIRLENRRCPMLRKFHRNSEDKWLELFAVDNGCGLAADIEEWLQTGNLKLRPLLKKIKPTTNIMSPLAKVLFSQPVSRLSRTEKTTVTGFQHISFVLAEQFDFARLYSMGEWVGSAHPWSHDQHDVTVSTRKRNGIVNTPVGTAWHFCIGLTGTDFDDAGKVIGNWNRLHRDLLDSPDAANAKPMEWAYYDERDLGQGSSKLDWEVDIRKARSLSMWLPGAITKQHIHSWLVFARRTAIARPKEQYFWLICDLAPREAKLFYEVMSREQFDDTEAPRLDVFLVTYTWHCLGVAATALGFAPWRKSKQEKMALKGSRSIFELIRYHDSTVFWDGVIGPDESASNEESSSVRLTKDVAFGAFLAEEIIWSRDTHGRPELVLDGYLDVTEALAAPKRESVARRALRRCWYALDEQLACIAADNLLVSMLPRERRAGSSEWYSGGQLSRPDYVLVNSISVTGQSIRSEGRHTGEVINLLHHPPRRVDGGEPRHETPRNGRIALEWRAGSVTLRPRDANSLPYERIPGTPYVGRGGAKAIPVRRFRRPTDNLESVYFEHSIYAADPQQTYDQFDRLNVLKIGHWSYGPHHQLLTVNLGKAIASETIDRGPMLRWLLRQLEELASLGVSVVIYPSHRVTDALVQALKRLSVESGSSSLPRNFIPVHFLGRHAQTAIRIPSLTYDRIKAALRESAARKAVILDDAVVTGKAQREFGQLLRNAGAEDVMTLGLLTRTGIPLYRNYLVSEYSSKNRFYWRWDVPSLGAGRHCPLCSAIGLAGSLRDSLFLEESSEEISSWIQTWAHSPVETHWERAGLVPGQLPSLREITFGKEWPKDGSMPIPYKLTHRTTTGLAATVVELIRVTAYKEVGLKIARRPAGRELEGKTERREWLRCVAEVLLVQTLLFFDDFEFGELEPRMSDLADLLLEIQLLSDDDLGAVPLELQQLICLTLLLAPEDILPYVVERILDKAGAIEHASVRILVTVGLLLRRTPKLPWENIVRRTLARHTDPEARRRALGFLSRSFATVGKKANDTTAQSCLILFLVLGASDRDSHSGLLRRLLLAKQPQTTGAILHDLQLAASALEHLPNALFQGVTTQLRVRELAAVMRRSADQLVKKLERAPSEQALATELDVLHNTLFLQEDGWIGIRDELAPDVERLTSFLRQCPSHDEWSEYLDHKQRHDPEVVAQWRKRGAVVLPNLSVRCDVSDVKKRLFCPPLALRMVKDYLLNVVHAVRRPGDEFDMHCQLVGAPGGVKLIIRNGCSEPGQVPKPKLSEALLSSLTDLITVSIDTDRKRHEIRVSIGLPVINAIWSKVTK